MLVADTLLCKAARRLLGLQPFGSVVCGEVGSSSMQVRRFSCRETAQRYTVATRTWCKMGTWRFQCDC
jgi:hypothetical protein